MKTYMKLDILPVFHFVTKAVKHQQKLFFFFYLLWLQWNKVLLSKYKLFKNAKLSWAMKDAMLI